MVINRTSLLTVPFICGSFLGYIFKWESLFFSWGAWFLFFSVTGFSLVQRIRIPVFILFSVWIYAAFGNLIPQQEFRAGSFEEIERSPEAFVEAGEKIFFGKGKCSSCHSIGPGVKSRCPDILKASREAGTRKSSLTARQYLIESVYKPSAYVVKGYTAIMPEVWKPPIGLTPVEIEMVIAYIQSLSGGDVDVSPIIAPVDLGKASFVQSGKALTVTGNLRKGKRVFESGKGKCLSCHKVFGKGGEGEEGAIGPDLSDIGALNTVEYIKESILYPNAKILKGYGIVDFRTKEGKRVEGLLVGENDRSLTVKGEGKERNYLKEKILFRKVRQAETRNLSESGYFWVRARLPGKAEIEGAIVDENSLEVEVRVAGESKVIKKSDIENIEGRRILRTSKMPRYDHVLTISEFNDLLAYVVSLRGKTVVGQ